MASIAAAGAQQLWPGGGRNTGGRGGCCGRIPQTATECLFFLFFFLKNSSYSSLPLQQAPGLLHSPTLQPDWGLTGSGSITDQIFPAGVHRLCVCTVPCVFASLSLFPPCDFKYPGPSYNCSKLVWQGKEPLTLLSSKNPVAELEGTGPRAAAALVPVVLPGTLLS